MAHFCQFLWHGSKERMVRFISSFGILWRQAATHIKHCFMYNSRFLLCTRSTCLSHWVYQYEGKEIKWEKKASSSSTEQLKTQMISWSLLLKSVHSCSIVFCPWSCQLLLSVFVYLSLVPALSCSIFFIISHSLIVYLFTAIINSTTTHFPFPFHFYKNSRTNTEDTFVT